MSHYDMQNMKKKKNFIPLSATGTAPVLAFKEEKAATVPLNSSSSPPTKPVKLGEYQKNIKKLIKFCHSHFDFKPYI